MHRLVVQDRRGEGQVGLVRVRVLALGELDEVAKGGAKEGRVDQLQLNQAAACLPD